MKRTEAEWLEWAVSIQDSCNLSGIVHSFSDAMHDLWTVAREKGHGTDWVNHHPVSRMFAEKCAQLAGPVDWARMPCNNTIPLK